MIQKSWPGFLFGFPALLIVLAALPQLQSSVAVTLTLLVAAAVLILWAFFLVINKKRNQAEYSVSFIPLAPHYVQAFVQIAIYAYWGWYWRPVYDHIGLIVAQLVFAYSLDILLSLMRRKRWVLGFGPFPIILSTNLFILFKPEWFYLQFLLVATGILGKEFIRWNRDGRNTHIFNPSAFSLFIFSVALIVTDHTSWTFAEEIAITLNQPPNIYLQIFLLGLIVQGLFSVTLVTLTSTLALIVLNIFYTEVTGVYYFIDSNIPIAVFLGLHLLITDPATSPRTAAGKAVFGILYGLSVFLLYGLLSLMGEPTFYDKLLCVPVLNLMVPWIDTVARKIWHHSMGEAGAFSEISRKANFSHMAIWVIVFSAMLNMSFIGAGHRGNDPAFWKSACENELRNGCQVLLKTYREQCRSGISSSCAEAGLLIGQDPSLSNRVEEGQLLALGCDLGNRSACRQFREYARLNKWQSLDVACTDGDAVSCYIVGMIAMNAVGIPANPELAVRSWKLACSNGWPRGCADLGEAYLFGRVVEKRPELAAQYLALACKSDYQLACTHLGLMYRHGRGVEKDEAHALTLLKAACENGWQPACNNL